MDVMKIEINVNNDLNDSELIKQLVQQLYTALGKERSILDDLVQELKALQYTVDNETWQKALDRYK
jgi:hypothetical protein